jgi:PAS domain-containing protein
MTGLTPPEPDRPDELRQRATERLTGEVRSRLIRESQPKALSVLYDLASAPASAPDALALLHELQVHQVELELQNEELSAAREALDTALQRMTELYDETPVGCLVLAGNLVVYDINREAARLLGGERGDFLGRSLATVQPSQVADALHELLARVSLDRGADECELQLAANQAAPLTVRARAVNDVVANRFLVALIPPAKSPTPVTTAPPLAPPAS